MPRKAEKVSISSEFAKSLEPPPGKSIVRVKDIDMPRFGVYKTCRQKGSYFIEYWHEGRRRHMNVAPVGEVAASKAKRLAKELFKKVNAGEDPLGQAKAVLKIETLGEFWERKFLPHALRHWKDRTAEERRGLWRRHIEPHFGKRRLDTLRSAEIVAWHRDMGDRPALANSALRLMKTICARAVEWEDLPSNPAARARLYKEKPREAFLTADEVHVLLRAIDHEESLGLGGKPRRALKRTGKSKGRGGRDKKELDSRGIGSHAAALFRLLIFTGARLREIMTARWSWVKDKELALPDSKTGARRVPLSSAALAQLDYLASIRTAGNPYLVEGHLDGSHLVNPQKPWDRVRERAHELYCDDQELDGDEAETIFQTLRLHDLRHSAASLAAAAGLSLLHIGAALGHTQSRTTERYSHLRRQAALEAVEAIATQIGDAASKKKKSGRRGGRRLEQGTVGQSRSPEAGLGDHTPEHCK